MNVSGVADAASRSTAASTAASSATIDPNLFSQLLKARLDSSLMSLGMSDSSSLSGLGGTGTSSSIMDMMLMSYMMQSLGSLQSEATISADQQAAAPATLSQQTTAAASQPSAGGIYISRVYTPDIPMFANWPQHTQTNTDAAISALTRVGDPYSQSRRGTGNYVDCSYLTLWAYGQHGVSLPATAAEQASLSISNGWEIPKEDLQIGDLVFWQRQGCNCGRYSEIHHVGIYLGDGEVVEASSSQGKVVVNELWGDDDDGWQIAFFARPK